MRIVYLYNALALKGGIERVLIDKMNYLANNSNYELFIITASQGTHPIAFPLSTKVKHIDLGLRLHSKYDYSFPKRFWVAQQLNRLFSAKLKEMIQQIKPDLLICTTLYFTKEAMSFQSSCKIIIESHENSFINSKIEHSIIKHYWNEAKQHKALVNLINISKKTDAFVVLTNKEAIKWKGAKNVAVIPNMIETTPLEGEFSKKRVVIAVGRLEEEKGYDLLLMAWKLVIARTTGWELHIYGEGSLKKRILEEIETSKLTESIKIFPPTTEIRKRYAESELLVLSSKREGFGLVLAEAMVERTPCVSFNCPFGPSSIIKDQEDGILVENGNYQRFADAIIYLLENEEVRREMGKSAQKNILRFSKEIIGQKWESLFQQLTRKV